MKCLNLGCGCRFHPDWVNLDSIACSKDVIKHDLQKGIPFEDNSFDVVYHSHVLEHFSQESGRQFIHECYRVLRPQGILRVVVPDLEQIAINYLIALEKAMAGDKEWKANYDWVLLELLDQVVRNYSGGAMRTYFQSESIENLDFVLSRFGTEAKIIISELKLEQELANNKTQLNKIKNLIRPIYNFLRYAQYRRDTFLKLALGKEYSALQIGRFRQSGELHCWMYDRYSLLTLLSHCEFIDIVQREESESYVQNWSDFNLDTELDGSIHKPDSIFMEAIKPTL